MVILSNTFLSYMQELKQTLLPMPATCAGFHCNHCHAPVLQTDSPMDFYDEEHFCDEPYNEPYDEPDVPEEPVNEDELNDYIDYMLDNDYDW